MKWTEAKVGYAVMHQIMDRAAVVVPNCNWTGYEADLLVVTSDLRLIDVEIKIDRSDLKADLKKDKWWRGKYITGSDGEKVGPFAPKIWKHYYVMPAKVWDDKLLGSIPSTSGVIVIQDYPHTSTKLLMKVIRRATPNRTSPKISPTDAFAVGRLCNLRMWDRIMKVESADRKLGSIEISTEYLRRIRAGEAPDPSTAKMLASVIVLDVTHDFMRDVTTYFAWSEEFTPTDPSVVPPRYTIEIMDGKPAWRKIS